MISRESRHWPPETDTSPRKPITLGKLIRGERLAEELTPQGAATMLTALTGVQLAVANGILTAKSPEPPRLDDSKLLKVDDVVDLLGTKRVAVYRPIKKAGLARIRRPDHPQEPLLLPGGAEETDHPASQPELVGRASMIDPEPYRPPFTT